MAAFLSQPIVLPVTEECHVPMRMLGRSSY
jgi:hypothetical protein